MADAVEWSIDFNTDGATYREQARFAHGPPDTRAFQAVKSEALLNFIEKLNETFKKAAESILSQSEATPEQRKQAEDIQAQFYLVDQWIAEMRKQFPQK